MRRPFQKRAERFNHNKTAARKLSDKFAAGNLPFAVQPLPFIRMLHEFQIAGQKVRLWQRGGESYEHVLMKALGYAMFAPDYPTMEIEIKVGLRYKPDLIARDAAGEFLFWGEAGSNAIRKTNWILKHTRTQKMALFKIGHHTIKQLVEQLRAEILPKYRLPERLILINFVGDIKNLTAGRQIEKVSKDWFTKTVI